MEEKEIFRTTENFMVLQICKIEVVDEEEMEKDIKKYNNMKKFLYFWAPVIMIAIIIIACIMANI